MAEETKWGSKLVFTAEYLLSYSVANHECLLWVDSGERGETEEMVRACLPQPRPRCRAMYRAETPEHAIGICGGHVRI
jgi:hypothetical protein